MNDTLGLRSKRAQEAAFKPEPARDIFESNAQQLGMLEAYRAARDGTDEQEADPQPEPTSIDIPPGWTKGQLLNVRNLGEFYAVTLLGEEFDVRHPERALQFTNTALCQDFISRWYQREHADPRAR